MTAVLVNFAFLSLCLQQPQERECFGVGFESNLLKVYAETCVY